MSSPVSTPVQFLVSQSQLDSMTMWIYIGIGGIVAFFVLLVFLLQDKFRTPKQAKNMTKAHHKHIPLFILAGLDQYADIIPVKEFIAQVLESFPFGKGAQKRTRRFALPLKVNAMESEIQVAPLKDPLVTKQYIQALNDLNTMRVTFRGMDTPVLVGTKNRSIAASLPFLSALSWTRDIEALVKHPEVIDALKNAGDSRIKSIGELLGRMSLGVSGVDFHAVYKNIDVNYDPTTDDSLKERYMTDGRMERAEDKDKPTKTVLYLILGIAALFVIGVVAAKLL